MEEKEEVKEEKEKKIDNKKLPVIILLLTVFLLFGFLILSSLIKQFNKKTNEKEADNTITSNYTGSYYTKYEDGESSYDIILYLRNDNTFRFSINGESQINHVGTYDVNNNIISLKTRVLFDSNGCYYKKGSKLNADLFNPIAITVLSNDSFSVFYTGQSYTLLKSNDYKEDSEDISTFNIDVVDSEDANYSDCTNRDKI